MDFSTYFSAYSGKQGINSFYLIYLSFICLTNLHFLPFLLSHVSLLFWRTLKVQFIFNGNDIVDFLLRGSYLSSHRNHNSRTANIKSWRPYIF